MNNQAASERKHDFPFTGMKVNHMSSTCTRYHCLQRDVGGPQVCVIKWEEKSEETSAEDGTELVTTVLPHLLIANRFENAALMDSLTHADGTIESNPHLNLLARTNQHPHDCAFVRLPLSGFVLMLL